MLLESAERAPEAVEAAATLDGAAGGAATVEGAGERGHVARLDDRVGQLPYYLRV